MMPFERGYADFLQGAVVDDNPFIAETAPYSFKRWLAGWKAGQLRKSEKMV